MNILTLIGRKKKLFDSDLISNESELIKKVSDSRFLVLGGAGSIGMAVVKEIFKRNPKKLHVVDINENNLVELVRDIRSAFGYIKGEFKTYALDIGSFEYDSFIENDGKYDYVLNLSALKHVRSERDPYTLMRMINVNIFNTEKTLNQSISSGIKKYFCVSTDKAANPVNMMGASKRIMEFFLMRRSTEIKISTARFANVAFSDGSLLHGFNQRIQKKQPIVAPSDVKRYFVTPEESGELCLMSCILGNNREIFFPKLNEDLHLTTFSEIALKYLEEIGYKPHICSSEKEARELTKTLPAIGKWPCLFVKSDTTGEKDFEEFYTENEVLDLNSFESLGIVNMDNKGNYELLNSFTDQIEELKSKKNWTKEDLLIKFKELIPNFIHLEKGKSLDNKM